MMKFIKKNKLAIIACIIVILLIVLAFQLKEIFAPEVGSAIYGNRLDGIEAVKISKDTLNRIEDNLKEDGVSKVTSRISGRTVEIIITVNSDVSIDTAKEYANKTLEPFSEEQKKYYDFQIFVKKDSDSSEFPIIGYKQKTKDNISWSKDRRENG